MKYIIKIAKIILIISIIISFLLGWGNNSLWASLGFLITIGILVLIHEWGHFAVARFFNVKILRFSLGFGKPLLSWTGKKDNTKYTLSPIPLGGFVQMLGENSEEEIKPEEKDRTFSAKPAWQRFLIVLAGPLINLIFAVLAFSLVFMNGVEGVKPEILHINEGSLAQKAGLRAGDLLLEIDGTEIKLSVDANVALAAAYHKPIEIKYLRGNQLLNGELDLSNLKAGDELKMSKTLGMFLIDEWFSAFVGDLLEDAPAKSFGLKKGDQILAINGREIKEGAGIYAAGELIKKLANQETIITIKRDNKIFDLTGKIGEKIENGEKIGFLGVYWQYRQPKQEFFDKYGVVEKYSLFPALKQGFNKSIYYVEITLSMLKRLIIREVSIDNMGGPLTVGDIAGKTLRIGFNVFLNFLGLVSLSLGVINLLPIPVLDGGHMLFCAIETIIRRPIPQKIQTFFFKVGATIIFLFMGLIIFNDFMRYLF